MLESFKNCGMGALAMLFLGLFGLLASALALLLTMSRKPGAGAASAAAAIALALLSFGAGPMFAKYGRSVTESALEGSGLPAADAERLRQEGYTEAGSCVAVGFSLGAMPLAAGVIALLVALRAKRKLALAGAPPPA